MPESSSMMSGIIEEEGDEDNQGLYLGEGASCNPQIDNSFLLVNDDLMFLRFLWGNQTLYSSSTSPNLGRS